jgi:hypothetical protein
VRDALGCFPGARPAALRPARDGAPDGAPAGGALSIAVAQGAIGTLTVAYDPA